jgi:hypothetical protein
MRKGYSDPRIAASQQTAAHNMRLLFELNELPQPYPGSRAWHAAIGIAVELEQLRLRHMAQRRAGLRAY